MRAFMMMRFPRKAHMPAEAGLACRARIDERHLMQRLAAGDIGVVAA